MAARKAKKAKRPSPVAAHEALRRLARERRARGEFPKTYMWLTLTEDAMRATDGLSNAELGEFVSEAVVREAKRRGMTPPPPVIQRQS